MLVYQRVFVLNLKSWVPIRLAITLDDPEECGAFGAFGAFGASVGHHHFDP